MVTRATDPEIDWSTFPEDDGEPMAETTATTCSPAATVSAIRLETLRIRAAVPTEVPPYFWTIMSRQSYPSRRSG